MAAVGKEPWGTVRDQCGLSLTGCVGFQIDLWVLFLYGKEHIIALHVWAVPLYLDQQTCFGC